MEGGITIHDVSVNNQVDYGYYSFSPSLFLRYYTLHNYIVNSLFMLDGKNKSPCVSSDCHMITCIFDRYLAKCGGVNEFYKCVLPMVDIDSNCNRRLQLYWFLHSVHIIFTEADLLQSAFILRTIMNQGLLKTKIIFESDVNINRIKRGIHRLEVRKCFGSFVE